MNIFCISYCLYLALIKTQHTGIWDTLGIMLFIKDCRRKVKWQYQLKRLVLVYFKVLYNIKLDAKVTCYTFKLNSYSNAKRFFSHMRFCFLTLKN